MDNKDLTRRQFLKDIGITCVCGDLLLSTMTARTVLAARGQRAGNQGLPNMTHRVLGRTGLKVSALSFGVMRLTDPTVLLKALDLGVNFFDTAHRYQNGNNEKMLGSVLKEYGRDKVLIATKIPPYQKRLGFSVQNDPEEMQNMMDESLRRLQTDYVDVLFLHSIKDAKWPGNENLLTFLEKQKKSGKARFVGISFHAKGDTYVNIVDEALKTDFYDVFLATLNFKSPSEHVEALRLARSRQVGVIAMKTQAGGYEKGIRNDLTPHQAALKWALDQNFVDCAIPGMVNREQLVQNMAVMDKKMSIDDRRLLDDYYASIKDHYCINCGACDASCEKGVDIQSIHRFLMYWEGYGDRELARIGYGGLSVRENALACMNCSTPTCQCINGIRIDERMRCAHRAFG